MSAGIQHQLLSLFAKYPLVGTAFFMVGGLWMTGDAIKGGREMARFVDGPRVTGVVAETRGKSTIPAHYEMTARWTAPDGSRQSGVVQLYANEFQRLSQASPVDLILAADNPAHAITTERLSGHEPINLIGVSVDPLVFGGLLLILCGVFFPKMARHLEPG